MLTIGIILLVLGAALAYFGRPREDIVYIGGILLFIAGLILVLIAVLDIADVDAAEHARSSWSHATELARSSWSHTTDVARSSWSRAA